MFKTVWDLVIVIIISGLVSTFEIGILGSLIGRMIESKMKMQNEYGIRSYEKVMDRFDKLTVLFFDKLNESIDKSKVQSEIRKIGFDNESEK